MPPPGAAGGRDLEAAGPGPGDVAVFEDGVDRLADHGAIDLGPGIGQVVRIGVEKAPCRIVAD